MGLIKCKPIVDQVVGESQRGGRLAVLYSGQNESSASYVRSLEVMAKRFDVEVSHNSLYDPSGSISYTYDSIAHYNENDDVHGVILLSPHPDHYFLIQHINSHKRVEGNDFDDDIARVSCTARACVKIIESVTDLAGKRVLIIGYGKAVGKPLSYLCMRHHVDSVVLTHAYTDQRRLSSQEIYDADIIVLAVGKPRFLLGTLKGKIIIDAGISMVDGQIVGDVDPYLAKYNDVSPVPGGVGPVTSALLMQNVTKAANLVLKKFA